MQWLGFYLKVFSLMHLVKAVRKETIGAVGPLAVVSNVCKLDKHVANSAKFEVVAVLII